MKAMVMQPYSTTVQTQLAWVRFHRKEMYKAKLTLKNAIEYSPYNDFAYGLLSQVYFYEDDLSKALTYLNMNYHQELSVQAQPSGSDKSIVVFLRH